MSDVTGAKPAANFRHEPLRASHRGRRYARDRPYFHPLVIERIQAFLKLDGPVPLALDVGAALGNPPSPSRKSPGP